MNTNGFTTGLRRGERVSVTVADVTAYGRFVAQCGDASVGTERLVVLDGTGQAVYAPAELVHRAEEN